MRFTIREIAGEWLAWDLGSYRPSGASTGAALKTALGQLNQLHVDMPNQGWYYPLLLEAVQGLSLDSQVAILSRLPSGSGVGPPIDRQMLRKLGKQSAPAYRAFLYLACEWDRYGGHNAILSRLPSGSGVGPPIDRQMLRKLGKQSAPAYRAFLYLACEWDRYGGHNGRLVRPTRPEVLRDPRWPRPGSNGHRCAGEGQAPGNITSPPTRSSDGRTRAQSRAVPLPGI